MAKSAAAWVLTFSLICTQTHAHHSFAAQFDPAKPFTINGAVTKIEWTNPHIYLYVDVKDTSGAVVNWAVEMGNPLQLVRLGWTRSDMKIGDSITVDGWLARDGAKLMNAKAVVVGGRKMFAGSSQAATP
jgi:hypothetical protein